MTNETFAIYHDGVNENIKCCGSFHTTEPSTGINEYYEKIFFEGKESAHCSTDSCIVEITSLDAPLESQVTVT